MIKAEQVYRMKRVPRSYDMSRTHIMHKSVNKHVDVVLRFAPKKWKKKPVKVHVVSGEKRSESIKIRVSAKKGYVAVKKAENPQYAAARKQIRNFDEKNVVDYETVHLKNRSLIHDMKSQVALMAKKSSAYIDEQLYKNSAQTNVTVEVSEQKPAESLQQQIESSMKSSAAQFDRTNGLKNDARPYANNYSKHVSDAEFRKLMDTLEKSLDEAYRQTSSTSGSSGDFVTASYSGYNQSKPLSVDASPMYSAAYENKSDDPFAPVTSFPASNDRKADFVPEVSDEFRIDPPVEQEQDYTPVRFMDNRGQPIESVSPTYAASSVQKEDDEFRPMLIRDEDEDEEFRPILIQDDEEPRMSGYAAQNHDMSDRETSYDSSVKRSETMLSRSGDKIKKAIGVIRGNAAQETQDVLPNEHIEISYSDDGEN